MDEDSSSSRRQSRYNRSMSEESESSSVLFENSVEKIGRQRSPSVESVQSGRKVSQEGNLSRKIPGLTRRISALSFFSNFKKPAAETKPTDEKLKKSFENTYQLEPKIRFPEGKVRAVIQEALDTLDSHTYSAQHTPFLVKLLTARVLENVKQLKIERYKIVCMITLGTKESQGVRVASRCLWNSHFDTYVSACFEREKFFAVGTVYGIYYE